ncbi:MAG: hypothetical protein AB1555_07525 [Nitrospirota bacterium]
MDSMIVRGMLDTGSQDTKRASAYLIVPVLRPGLQGAGPYYFPLYLPHPRRRPRERSEFFSVREDV